MLDPNICLVGGTGFVGRHVACELTRRGYTIRVLTRRRERHRELLVHPTLELLEVDVHDADALTTALTGFSTVINLPGILNSTAGNTRSFSAVHVELVEKVVSACRSAGASRLLHMSALNASAQAPSEYLRTKAAGEAAVLAASEPLAVSIFRPSVIFGHDDSFFNRFAQLLAITPGIFPLACPDTRFAPVYVGDVATAFVNTIDDKGSHGVSYDLCGPRTYRLQELVEYTARVKGLRRKVVGLGDAMSRLQASVLEKFPGKPFSTDNYRSMQVDSVCECNGLQTLGITPTSVESVVPAYLGAGEPNTRYRLIRTHSGRG